MFLRQSTTTLQSNISYSFTVFDHDHICFLLNMIARLEVWLYKQLRPVHLNQLRLYSLEISPFFALINTTHQRFRSASLCCLSTVRVITNRLDVLLPNFYEFVVLSLHVLNRCQFITHSLASLLLFCLVLWNCQSVVHSCVKK